ncbi:alpha/beta-hydrolase [Gloeophyllum trabeum ATCC 11539]|uniref:Alpha/beta-hydrolase n=1 Tax=Gloeophyllum trabeum (strain ATCC 11539 / FP-39264 / Madison 617) TaxID=670483 RepID=S7Q5Q7_GLOTA|nr:alpha/beta-hydrolase [Gloeophyllum trabeum ATCC 11539]EPQ54812.1 alpha/beta-hydrolase [Gloeophyllum trabeum ATCC 11539]
MNSVLCLSAPVYLFIRRVVHVLSALSISNQYVLLQSGKGKVDTGVLNIQVNKEKAFNTAGGIPDGPATLSSSKDVSPSTDGNVTNHHENNESRDRSPDPTPEPGRPSEDTKRLDTIHQLLQNPVLYDPIRTPRHPIALCHGLYGFDVRGPSSFPSLQMHYWSNVLQILKKKVGAEVIVTSVPATGSIASRAENLDRALKDRARGKGINFMAHSMGGLDCRHLISHIKPRDYTPVSLTTVATPHRGSPFMDWCASVTQERIGIGKLKRQEQQRLKAEESTAQSELDPLDASSAAEKHTPPPRSPSPLSISLFPSSFTTFLMSILDSPAYANLTSTYLNEIFNPTTPDDPRVKYFSVAARIQNVAIWHPFWLPKMVLDGVEQRERQQLRKEGEEMLRQRGWTREDYVRMEGRPPIWEREDEWGNDGLVTVQSARWGEFLGIMEGCDHWHIRGARGLELDIDIPNVSFGIGNSFGEGWSLSDWTRFVTAWRKEEKKKETEKKKENGKVKKIEKKEREETLSKAVEASQKEKERRAREADDHDDDFLKSSTDKLSAVFDWLVEQVPTPARAGVSPLASSSRGASASPDEKSAREQSKKSKKPSVKNELETKEDLERFYVALSRKLYDEGL